MNELLDVTKVEVAPVGWYLDEEHQRFVNVPKELSDEKFGEFMKVHSSIGQLQTDIKWKCLYIGWALKTILDEKLYCYVRRLNGYVLNGYSSFYKFVKEVYGIKERTAKRLVAVARECCRAFDPKLMETMKPEELKNVPSCQIRLEYLNYSYSQLSELLSIEEKFRPRIPIKASVRDIRNLGKLYKTGYVPKTDETYQDDLEVYRRYAKDEKEKKNAEKKRIEFCPSVPTSAPDENAFDDFEEDERDVITPTEGKKLSLQMIKSGFTAQLNLLKQNYPDWATFADKVSLALELENPDLLIVKKGK